MPDPMPEQTAPDQDLALRQRAADLLRLIGPGPGDTEGQSLRALSLTQPWASLVATDRKRIETRSWATGYRGAVLIHAAKGMNAAARDACVSTGAISDALIRDMNVDPGHAADQLPRGAVLAVAEVHDCRQFAGDVYVDVVTGGFNVLVRDAGSARSHDGPPLHLSVYEYAFGDFTRGRYGHLLRNIVRLPQPIPCAGHLSLWKPGDELLAGVVSALREIAGPLGPHEYAYLPPQEHEADEVDACRGCGVPVPSWAWLTAAADVRPTVAGGPGHYYRVTRGGFGELMITADGGLAAVYCRSCAKGVPFCRVCGCTERMGCAFGCWWVRVAPGEDPLCSRCAEPPLPRLAAAAAAIATDMKGLAA